MRFSVEVVFVNDKTWPAKPDFREESLHIKPGIGEHSKIPLSDKAHALFDDWRIKAGYSLLIFVLVTESNYLFLWGDNYSEYCDVRPLENQIDQDFIDSLLGDGGTQATGLYSVLWSPYRAGRVFKDTSGKTKAVCVIKSE